MRLIWKLTGLIVKLAVLAAGVVVAFEIGRASCRERVSWFV